ncbi:MAG: hypothetical protein ABIA76_01610 [Candidatus Diapherotrites archaeon]
MHFMMKKELIYLLVSSAFVKGINHFTQKQVSTELSISLSTVNNALKPLQKMHAIEIRSRSFSVRDFRKLLAYWATIRNFENEIIYSTFFPEKPDKIEGLMPSNVFFSAFSAVKFSVEAPADYSEIYVYSSDLPELKKRFPLRNGPKNVFVLQSNALIERISKNNCVPLPLAFVDLWNLSQWYAKEFLEKAEKRLLD